jgi:hypothetical protein
MNWSATAFAFAWSSEIDVARPQQQSLSRHQEREPRRVVIAKRPVVGVHIATAEVVHGHVDLVPLAL